MGVAATGPNPIYDVAHRPLLLKFLEITTEQKLTKVALNQSLCIQRTLEGAQTHKQ